MSPIHRRTALTTSRTKNIASSLSMGCKWAGILLSTSLWVAITARGVVDGFVPNGVVSSPFQNNLDTRTTTAHSGFNNNNNRGRFRESVGRIQTPKPPARRGRSASRVSSSTQLGITLVLPLPVAGPRLSGTILRAAESWAPTIGVWTATLLYLAPARAVWKAIRRARNHHDGDEPPMDGLNPLPIALLPCVATSWLAYGLVASDPYIILGNLPGTLLSIAYLIGILPLMNYNAMAFPTLEDIGIDGGIVFNKKRKKESSATPKSKPRRKPRKSKTLILTQATVLLSTASTLALWGILGLLTAGATDGMYRIGGLEFGMGFSSMLRSGVIVQMLGVYAASVFILLGASPLSTISTVLKTKNSKTILGPFTAAQCVNTGLWTAYGLAEMDHFVWGPNIIGLGLGLIQLALKILYPAKKKGRKGENAARPSLEVSSTAQTIAVVGTDETIESNKTDNLAPDERRELPETSSSP